jgi:hypothetical protein
LAAQQPYELPEGFGDDRVRFPRPPLAAARSKISRAHSDADAPAASAAASIRSRSVAVTRILNVLSFRSVSGSGGLPSSAMPKA